MNFSDTVFIRKTEERQTSRFQDAVYLSQKTIGIFNMLNNLICKNKIKRIPIKPSVNSIFIHEINFNIIFSCLDLRQFHDISIAVYGRYNSTDLRKGY